MSKLKLPMRFKAALAVLALVSASLAALLATTAGPAVASVSAQSAASQNWAGYVASGKSFSSVSGSWTEPKVGASSDSNQAYSAQWVGLGGSGNSSSLEQIGTSADYVDGQADYYAWYELLPAAQVKLNMAIHPGDKISATVSVTGTTVHMSLTDNTTGQSVNKTLSMSNPDTSSAEWIVEAPAAEMSDGSAQVLPLADFSRVTFSSATATADGHTGGISDPNWSATKVQLPTGSETGAASGGPAFMSADGAGQQPSAGATTSGLSGDSFSVSWQADTTGQSVSGQPSQGQYPGDASSGGYGNGGYGYGAGGYGYGGGGYGGGYGYGSSPGVWVIIGD